MTKTFLIALVATLVMIPSEADARCGSASGGLFSRLRARIADRRASRQERAQAAWALSVPQSMVQYTAGVDCPCVQQTGVCNCAQMAAAAAWQPVPVVYQAPASGCQIINGQMVCPRR